MKKIYVTVIAVIMLCALALSGCGSEHFSEIYDDEQALTSAIDSSASLLQSVSHKEGEITVRHRSFNGVLTVKDLTVDSDCTLNLKADFKVYAGDFKVLVVDLDNRTVLGTAELTGDGSAELDDLSLAPGRYAIRIAGRGARDKGEITYTLG